MALTILGIDPFHWLIIAVTLGSVYILSKIIYNLYFHPLARFPGPRRAVISNAWYAKHWVGGRYPYDLEKLHREYGDVVRYATDDLSFATPQAYQDIYGHVKQGKQTFVKGNAYSLGPQSVSIVSERDPIKHREVRKSLSHAFSAKALRLQTELVLKYVDRLVDQITKQGNAEHGINVGEWYEWITFDIIGDLAFGESFGAVENTKTHPWVKIVGNSAYAGQFVDVFRRLPFFKLFPWVLMTGDLLAQRKEHYRLSMEKVNQRLEMGSNRDDFFSHLLSDKATNITPIFLLAQASTLIVAGSETTAVSLTATSYFLLKNPSTLYRLAHEIRSTFENSDLISGDSTEGMAYLIAVIEEALRLVPPVPAGLHRISPGAVIDGHYVPKGTTVSVSGWSTTHDERFFHNAREFHPERWLPPNHPFYDQTYKDDMKDASKPFLLGPRGCLGINLAYMEMRIILSKLVWHFDWELINEEVDWDTDAQLQLLWKKPELKVRFKPAMR